MSEFNLHEIPQEPENSTGVMARLLAHIDEIHTTQKGSDRIKKNLKLGTDDISSISAYCKSKIADKKCRCAKRGKNYYCEVDDIRLTINSSSYTIITAHIIKAKNSFI